MVQAWWTTTNNIKRWIASKKDYDVCLVGLQRVLFFERLPRNQTINSDVYCRQLNKWNTAVKEKNQKFYEREIMKLPEKWKMVIEQNRKYIID